MKITVTTDDGIVVYQWSVNQEWTVEAQNPYATMRKLVERKLPVVTAKTINE